MAEYRAYTVGVDGHFVGFESLTCADDAEAIEKAKRLVDGQDIELWSGPGLVIRISPAKRNWTIPVAVRPNVRKATNMADQDCKETERRLAQARRMICAAADRATTERITELIDELEGKLRSEKEESRAASVAGLKGPR